MFPATVTLGSGGSAMTDITLAGKFTPATIASLAPGATETVTATLTAAKEQVTAGTLSTSTVATGTVTYEPDYAPAPTSAPATTTVTTVPPAPAMSLTKLGLGDTTGPSRPRTLAGVPITFTYQITNTGNRPLTDIDITDTHGQQIDCSAAPHHSCPPRSPPAPPPCRSA